MPSTPAPAVPATIPVGRNHEIEPVAMVRTAEQRAVVARIVAQDDFDFACGNPLSAEVSADYTGPFSFVYYTKDGELHLKRIGKLGHILRDIAR